MPRLLCKPRVIYLCDCGLYNDQPETAGAVDLSTAEGVEHARQQVLDLTDALENVSEADKKVIAALIIDSATDDGDLDLDAVKDAIDALASDNPSSSAKRSAKSIAKKIIRAASNDDVDALDLETAEGVRRAQQEMLELAAQLDQESQRRHDEIALAIIRAAGEVAQQL